MDESFGSRLKHAWNSFFNRDPTVVYVDQGGGSYRRPDRPRMTGGNEKSIVTSICNRIAMDVASQTIQHVKLDEEGRFLEVMDSGLNQCLTLEANLDQTGREFIFDAAISLLDEGVIALLPIDTIDDPENPEDFDVLSVRTGRILEWHPDWVKVRTYNERTGRSEDLPASKRVAAIAENPFYAVMNEPNSTMKRLIRKLNLLDAVDEQSSSGKLDLIIQLPYVVKTKTKEDQAERRRQSIEDQLTGSKYGIAYTDGTERVIQLNRPVENNLMKQIEFLTSMLSSQLGITQSVMDGTADEKTMLNYYTRTVEPIVSALVDAMKRRFLSKSARDDGESIMFYRDPFRLVPVNDLAEIVDKFTRNEVMSSNEFRQIVGRKPSQDPKADQLLNKNLNHPEDDKPSEQKKEETGQNGKA